MSIRVFVDTDVIISAALSTTGASYQLLANNRIRRYISNFSEEEAKRTAKKLKISSQDVVKKLDMCISIHINESFSVMKEKYGKYANDPPDSHVVAGAADSKAQFLITYNLKDFKIELIKRELDIIVISPGTLLQYLRSKQ